VDPVADGETRAVGIKVPGGGGSLLGRAKKEVVENRKILEKGS